MYPQPGVDPNMQQGGAPAAPTMPQMPPQAPMPQPGMQMDGGAGGTPTNPLIAELDNRLRQFSPQELQMLDVELSRASPQFLQLVGKLFPELQQALMVLQQMGGDQGPQITRNPLANDDITGLTEVGY